MVIEEDEQILLAVSQDKMILKKNLESLWNAESSLVHSYGNYGKSPESDPTWKEDEKTDISVLRPTKHISITIEPVRVLS